MGFPGDPNLVEIRCDDMAPVMMPPIIVAATTTSTQRTALLSIRFDLWLIGPSEI
jgi:hypothetical protein